METVTIILFCIILAGSIASGISVVVALLAGLLLFLAYGMLRGFSLAVLLRSCFESLYSVRKILITFVLLGVLTAFWRASGTIPAIICYALRFIRPATVIPAIFLLNCAVSFLTGSSFGTAATMGVISLGISNAMGIPAFLAGGAMLSGAYFGDRCSVVSTCALLVSTLTKTDLYDNIKNMFRSAAVPFAVSLTLYVAAGYFVSGESSAFFDTQILRNAFRINLLCVLPAIVVILLALFKSDIRITLSSSCICAFLLAMFFEKESFSTLLQMAFFGYRTKSAAAALINGGGIVSMLKSVAIVGTASCYAGIFEKTQLLGFMKKSLLQCAKKTGNYSATLIVSIITAAVSCNQTLTVMLTHQLTNDFGTTAKQQALNLSDSAVVVSPLIPWCIACTVPLTVTGAPETSIFCACYLWLIPLWRLVKRQKYQFS